jgi:hypothetical protein
MTNPYNNYYLATFKEYIALDKTPNKTFDQRFGSVYSQAMPIHLPQNLTSIQSNMAMDSY